VPELTYGRGKLKRRRQRAQSAVAYLNGEETRRIRGSYSACGEMAIETEGKESLVENEEKSGML